MLLHLAPDYLLELYSLPIAVGLCHLPLEEPAAPEKIAALTGEKPHLCELVSDS